MEIKMIYVYEGHGGTIQSPIEIPGAERTLMRRLVADEGKILVNGDRTATAIDVEEWEVSAWTEEVRSDEPERATGND